LQNFSYDTIKTTIDNPIFLINLFAARCFLDIFDNEQYVQRIKIFLQKQLEKIKIPFIEHIIITNLNLGDRLPEIKVMISINKKSSEKKSFKDIFKPWIDEHGLWSHIKISYDGKLQLTLNAKLKWIRNSPKKTWRKRLWSPIHWFRYRRSNTRKINKQENDFEKVLPKISKTTIVIKLEMNNLNGILLFNIPPIPSDRIWISFFDMPEMEFSV
jgi:hypothetical protein